MKTAMIATSVATLLLCGVCEGNSVQVIGKPPEDAILWVPIFQRNNLNTAQKVAKAMGIVETGGVARKGASGEMKTIWQWLPATWNLISREYNREVNGSNKPLPLNCSFEEYVVVWKCQQFLKKGYTPKEIGMIWNTSLGGKEKPLRKIGINKHGVEYNSVRHGEKVHKVFNSL